MKVVSTLPQGGEIEKKAVGGVLDSGLVHAIKSIKMIVKRDKKKYYFYLSKTGIKGSLPRTEYDEGEKDVYRHALTCHDDEIYVLHNGQEIKLSDWLGKVVKLKIKVKSITDETGTRKVK